MLRSMLTRHPRIACVDEILNRNFNFALFSRYWSLAPEELAACKRLLVTEPIAFFNEYVFAAPDPDRDVFGFRLFYDQHSPGHSAELWAWLNAQQDIRIIHLQRRNGLRQFVSLRTAMATSEWVRTQQTEIPAPPLQFRSDEFKRFVARTEVARDLALRRLENLTFLDLAYEDLLSDRDAQMLRTYDFLGVESIRTEPRTLRMGGQRLVDRISNYDAMRDSLLTSPDAWMLEEEEGEVDVSPAHAAPSRASVSRAAGGRTCTRLVAQVSMHDVDILPHWVRHYRALGIAHFHLILHGRGLKRWRLRLACRRLGLIVECEIEGQFSDEEKRAQQQAIVERHRGEWLLLVDADEFLELPYRDFATTIRALETLGVSALPAVMVQRVANDGSLPPVAAETDLESRFPLASMLLSELMGSHPITRSKFPLFLATESTQVHVGQHQQPNSDAANYIPIRAVLHHYKWRDRLYADLEKRTGNTHISYLESRAYLNWLRGNADRLPLKGTFSCDRDALRDRGLLRRADRREIAFASLLHRVRTARSSLPEKPGGGQRLQQRIERAVAQQGFRDSNDALPVSTSIGPAGRIAIVTFELLVPDRSGGIGTWAANLAMSLRAAGHKVTIVYVRSKHDESSWPPRYWQSNGIELIRLAFHDGRRFAEDSLLNLAYLAFEALTSRTWDMIHVADALATGWQIVAAKRAGLAFQNTPVVVTLHGNNWWHRTHNRLPVFPHDVELDHLEVEQIRGADAVISPSRYMLEYIRGTYPSLPREGYVNQNLVPWPFSARSATPNRREIRELVFFGRLEPRKGLWVFCDAVTSLMKKGIKGVSVTFLGAFGPQEIRSELMETIGDWPDVRIIESFQVEECRLYLSEGDKLAVMPSSGDNSPYTVLECLAEGIPFIATRVGGVAELVAAEDREQVMVEQGTQALADALQRVLVEGAVVARPATPPQASELRLLLWHEHVLAKARSAKNAQENQARNGSPAVSVCFRSAGERPAASPLGRWIRSAGIDIELLVRTGDLGAHVALQISERQSTAAPHRIMLKELDWAGPNQQAHLNRLAAHGSEEILVFSDLSIQPDPGSVAMLARAMVSTRAAAIVPHIKLMVDLDGKPMPSVSDFRLIPTAAPALARLKNVFGAPIFAVRREVFNRLGGLDVDQALGRAWHWEFLARLTEAGERVCVMPFCFGSWRIDAAQIDRDWPWGPPALLEGIDGGRPTIARQHLQLLQDYMKNSAPPLHRVRLAAGEAITGSAGEVRERQALLQLHGAGLKALHPMGNTRLTHAKGGVEISSRDDDPRVRLPTVAAIKSIRDLSVEISLHSPSEGNLKVYWRNGKTGETYVEDRSVARYLLPGENTITLKIHRPNLPVSLRLDPGETAATYLLRSIAVFGE